MDSRGCKDPMHICWPVYEPYLVSNVAAKLNQTTGCNGFESNIEPSTHVFAGKPGADPQEALGERKSYAFTYFLFFVAILM